MSNAFIQRLTISIVDKINEKIPSEVLEWQPLLFEKGGAIESSPLRASGSAR